MSQVKVLELCEAYGGGVKRQLDYICQYLDPEHFKLTVLVSSKRSHDIPENYIIDDNLSRIQKSLFSLCESIKTVQKLVKENKIQIIHAHSTLAGLVAMFFVFFHKSSIKVIYTPHAYYSEAKKNGVKKFLVKGIEKIMNAFFSLVIHVSQEEATYALSNGLLNNEKSRIILNGVKDPYIKEREHAGSSFINIARCDYQKNPQFFIRLAVEKIRIEKDAKFLWVGDGPMLEECRHKVKEMGLETKIRFVGYSKKVNEYLENADIFLSTSRYEGLPFSVVEAMAARLPIILTDAIGHKGLIHMNGVLIENDDKASLSEIMDSFAYVQDHQLRLGKKSYIEFLRKYTLSKMISGIGDAYKDIASNEEGTDK